MKQQKSNFFEPIDLKNSKIRFLPNVSKASNTFQTYYMPKRVESEIDFIKRSLPFLRKLKENIYVEDINVFKVDTKSFTKNYNYECKFTFVPFADGSDIEMSIFIDDGAREENVLMYSPNYISVNAPSSLINDYANGYTTPKIITLEELDVFLNNAQNWVIDIIVTKSPGSKHNESIINKYIPESFMNKADLKEYIKSRTGLKKFNL